MTVEDMHAAINAEIQRRGSADYFNFQPQEIDLYLNEAVELFLQQRIDAILSSRESIQKDQIMQGIYPLVRSFSSDVSIYSQLPNTYSINLPLDYYHYLLITTTKPGKTSNTIFRTAKMVSPSDLEHYIETEDNSPIFETFPAFITDSKLCVMSSWGLEEPSKIRLQYLTSPDVISISDNPPTDCNLPSFVHRQIVEMALVEMTKMVGTNDS